MSDHPGGLGLVGLGLAMLLDVVVAQHDGQPSHLLGSHAETGQVVVFKKCLLRCVMIPALDPDPESDFQLHGSS